MTSESKEFAPGAKGVPSPNKDTRRLVLQLAVLALLLTVIPFTLANDSFTRGVANMLYIHAVLAVSFQMLFGQAGLISFGHAAMYGLGAYGAAVGVVRLEFPAPVAWAISLAVVVVVALVVGRAILRLGLLFLAVATLALGEAVVMLAGQLRFVGGEDGMSVPRFISAGAAQSLVDYGFTAVLLLLVMAIALALPSTRYGREMRAIGDDHVAAMACGIPVARRRAEVFALTSALAGAGGIAYAHTARFIAPSVFDLDTGILILAMVAIGGMHSVWGAVAGAALLTLLPELAASLLRLSTLIYGVVLIAIFRFAPDGLAGLGRRTLALARRGSFALSEDGKAEDA